MKVLIFDNYDSFTYNLVHLVKELGYNDVNVYRNDKISLSEVGKYDKIILSPGPGIPSESGLLLPLIKKYAPMKSILGVCLGHQAIAEAFGGQLINLENVYHGITTSVRIIVPDLLFDFLDNPPHSSERRNYKKNVEKILRNKHVTTESIIQVGRYHSWIVDKEHFPDCLTVTAEDDNGQIMALRHKQYDVRGVQFHPESVLTPKGKLMIEQWLKH